MGSARPPDETIEEGLRALLAHNPTASIAAVGLDSMFQDVPEDLCTGGHRQIQARWSLDLVTEEDRSTVIDLWERSLVNGTAHAAVTLVDGTHGTFHLFDVQATRGCSILVLVPGSDVAVPQLASGPSVPITPRHVTATRNQHGAFTVVDENLCQLLHADRDQIEAQSPLELIHPEDHKRAIDNWIETVSAKGAPRRYRARHWRGDGTWVWLELTNHLRSTPDGSFEVVSEMVDISEEMAMHEALREREEFLRRLTSALPVAVGQLDADGHFVFTNERLSSLLGGHDAPTKDDLTAIVAPDQRQALRHAIDAVFAHGGDIDLEMRTTPMGSATARVHRIGLCALRDGSTVLGVLLSMTDVTESADLREALRRRATFDDLTGLHNRASIMTLLGNAIGAGRENGSGTAVVFVDLDGFKRVNDDFGHAAGDDVLVRLARRLRAAVRRHDLVGRIGGDEFLVVCPELDAPSSALEVADRIADQLADDMEIAGRVIRSRASIGVAWTCAPTTSPEDLIRAADSAMYESKRSGSGRPVLAGLPV
jgi:diguanylate cyclase (GGDEF)-like protein/PAS domain S-box-containing protein